MLIVWVIFEQTFVQHPHSQLAALLHLQQGCDEEHHWNDKESDQVQSQKSTFKTFKKNKKNYLEVLREGWLYFVWSFPLEIVWLWLWCERYKLTVSEKCLKGASSVSLAVWNPKQRRKGLLRDQRSSVQKTFLFLINSNLLNKVYLQVWKCIIVQILLVLLFIPNCNP